MAGVDCVLGCQFHTTRNTGHDLAGIILRHYIAASFEWFLHRANCFLVISLKMENTGTGPVPVRRLVPSMASHHRFFSSSCCESAVNLSSSNFRENLAE